MDNTSSLAKQFASGVLAEFDGDDASPTYIDDIENMFRHLKINKYSVIKLQAFVELCCCMYAYADSNHHPYIFYKVLNNIGISCGFDINQLV